MSLTSSQKMKDYFGLDNELEVVTDSRTSEILECHDDILNFIVGGTKYQVLKSNFAYWPRTRLSRIVRAADCKKDILKLCDNFRICPKSGQPQYIFNRRWNNFNSLLDMYTICFVSYINMKWQKIFNFDSPQLILPTNTGFYVEIFFTFLSQGKVALSQPFMLDDI